MTGSGPEPAKPQQPSQRKLRLSNLKWPSINTPPPRVALLFAHGALSFALCMVLIFALDGYKARDDGASSPFSNGELKLRASDIITVLSAFTKAVEFIAGLWAGTLVLKCGFVVWKKVRDDPDDEKIGNELSRAMDWHFPKRGSISWTDVQDLAVRLSLALVVPALLAAPLIEGSVDWQSSFELGTPTTANSANPVVQFWRWTWPSSGGMLDRQEITEAASLAGLAWENATSPTDNTPGRKPCRHVVNQSQFLSGSKLHNATVPSIVIHSITWPSTPMPGFVSRIFNNSQLTSASNYSPFTAAIDHPGIAILFDPTNTTLPIPPTFANNRSRSMPELTFLGLGKPMYPEPFLWSARKMVAIVLLSKRYDQEPYLIDPFGLDPSALPNRATRSELISIVPGGAGVQEDQVYTYLEVNFTAGVRVAQTSTYIKHNLVEADGGDPDGGDIVAGPWVQQALYMVPDVMAMLAIINTTELATWENLFNYTETLVRRAYMGSWDALHRQFEPNNTVLVVDPWESRLEAKISLARVLGWLAVNVIFGASGFLLHFLTKRDGELANVNEFADFMGKVGMYAEAKRRANEGDTNAGAVNRP